MTRIITILCLLVSSQAVTAQDMTQLSAIKKTVLTPVIQKPTYESATKNKNEVESVFAAMFLFYKNVISSQDAQRCTFHPSCSEYGMESVKKFGAAKGMLMTFDRMTRCNGLSPQKYAIDPQKGVFLDPITNDD